LTTNVYLKTQKMIICELVRNCAVLAVCVERLVRCGFK